MLIRIISLKFLFILFIICPFALPARSLEESAAHFANKLENFGVKKIAVLNFRSIDNEKSGELVRERFTTYLVNNGKVNVIERSQLREILKEFNLAESGLLQAKGARKVGKILGVDAVLTGSVSRTTGQSLEVNARVVLTQTARIIAADRFSVKSFSNPVPDDPPVLTGPVLGRPLVQIGILLDTSNSMDGLISQAKTRIWRIVNELATAERKGNNPEIQVALYEYGNDGIHKNEGHIRQVLGFTSDMDEFSEALFSLKTNGGDEYAGKVIESAVNGLAWKKHVDVYKTVFIAGNEPFTQGPVAYQSSIQKARNRGIIINTIFCGGQQQGRATGWQSAATLGMGDYMNINHNKAVVQIVAPQDNEIQRLGKEINQTYIPYGTNGKKALIRQQAEDNKADAFKDSGASIGRSVYKTRPQYSRAANWDLVSLVMSGQLKIKDIKSENLPEALRGLSKRQLSSHIKNKIEERKRITNRVGRLQIQRKDHIKRERKKTNNKNHSSLDDAMIKSIHKQAEALNYTFN